MRIAGPIYVAFAISGFAGLIYEVLWSRYLTLFVGHGAYAQVLVLSVYLGGMAVGSLAVGNFSRRLRDPLRAYVFAELALAAFGLAFHASFVAATELSYAVVFPALGDAGLAGAVRWGVAGALVLPQAILLGATFPLMSAGVVRADEERPGRGVALVYLLNTLGGAAGVLAAGFFLVGRLGLPGTSITAALLNLIAAATVWALRPAVGSPAEHAAPAAPSGRGEAATGESATGEEATGAAAPGEAVPGEAATAEEVTVGPGAPGVGGAPDWADHPRALGTILLVVAFGTALASFAYEIGWIRMLSLVLGSATHSFELMLSAFILGLAAGAWLVRNVADRTDDPVRLLGRVQVFMGVAAAASIPLYVICFDLMEGMMETLPSRADGYVLFNVARYGLCLLVMLPATTLAGATLPLVTGALLRAGRGEGSIGAAYGANTIGSVVGAGLAGLVALPVLGLKGLVLAGALLDVLLGLWLLARSARVGAPRFALARTAVPVALVFGGIALGARLSPELLTSGVFRFGDLAAASNHLSLYYRDGRTATISAHRGRSDGVVVLATNGKPDASIGPRWLEEGRDTLPPTPVPATSDFTTQVLGPAVGLAYRPDARSAANIGHGSGMTATTLLTSEALERLVTIEIEPRVVEGSLVFLPANATAFEDLRSSFVFDDAKSYFSYGQERFDLIFAEPSNPWVSGISSLFTVEFYRRVSDSMSDGAVLAQWMHVYELDDDLFLSVLAAIDAVFPAYRAYLVGDADVAIVASADSTLSEPDWSVLGTPAFRSITASAPEFGPETLNALLLFDESTFRPLLDRGPAVNSDYHPVLDAGAERARFRRTHAEGVYEFATARVDLGRILVGAGLPPAPYRMVPARGLVSAVLQGRSSWLREVLASGGGIAPVEFPEWGDDLLELQAFLQLSGRDSLDVTWESWSAAFSRVEQRLHWRVTGWADPRLYGVVDRLLDRLEAPPEARASVELARAFALGDWVAASVAAEVVEPSVARGERWIDPDLLMDMSVSAHLLAGRPEAARSSLEALLPRTARSDRNLRNRLLTALVEDAGTGAGSGRDRR